MNTHSDAASSPSDDTAAHGHAPDQLSRRRFAALLLGCIGVVYGDIGTSPLYAFRTAAKHVAEDGMFNHEILGILSLIIWALTLIVTVKYVIFLLRLDNRGEGGILSLMALTQRRLGQRRTGVVFFAGVIGAALFFGDAAITPAISVLSAIEGIKLVTPAFDKLILPIAMVILIGLFVVQKQGTASVSKLFGPIMVVWFLTLAGIGIYWICKNPAVLHAFNPVHGYNFLISHGYLSFIVVGSIFLAITGAEALYSDLGHFGRRPIQLVWLYAVFPCLTLNYLGQGRC